MEQKTVLLNGGRDRDVVPLEGADAYLDALLGPAPSKPAIPILRCTNNGEGQACVGVFIGSTQVGYLASDDTDLLATVQACEASGAVARARGQLLPSWDRPGKVKVRVSLANPDNLVSGPAPDQSGPPADMQAPVESEPAGTVQLSSGWTEDYPEWPPQKPKSATPEQAVLSMSGSLPTVAPGPVPKVAPVQVPLQPAENPTTGVLSSARSQTPQAGWLGSASRQAVEAPAALAGTTSVLNPLGGPLTQTLATPAADTSPTPTGGQPSWQDLAERASGLGPLDAETAKAWVSPATSAQSTAADAPGPMVSTAPRVNLGGASRSNRTLMLSVLAVVVLGAAAFLGWKTIFAPKTFVSETYGYSYTYPGRWAVADKADQNTMMEGFVSTGAPVKPLEMSAAGYGLTEGKPGELGLVLVAVFEGGVLGDQAQVAALLQRNLGQASAANAGVSVVDAVTNTTVGGLAACQMTVTMTSAALSFTVTYCFVFASDRVYELVAVADNDHWSSDKKAFDRFFASFKPGVAKP